MLLERLALHVVHLVMRSQFQPSKLELLALDYEIDIENNFLKLYYASEDEEDDNAVEEIGSLRYMILSLYV